MKQKDLLFEKIIGPIKQLCPSYMKVEDYLAVVFGTTSRIISCYSTARTTYIPGLYLENDSIPVQGVEMEQRKAGKSEKLWVRIDDHDQNSITVELKGKVFLLNRLEWNLLRRDLIKRVGSEEI